MLENASNIQKYVVKKMDAAKSQHRLIVLRRFAYDGIEVFPLGKALILPD